MAYTLVKTFLSSDEKYLFIAAGTDGLIILDVENPENTTKIAHFILPNNSYVFSVLANKNNTICDVGAF